MTRTDDASTRKWVVVVFVVDVVEVAVVVVVVVVVVVSSHNELFLKTHFKMRSCISIRRYVLQSVRRSDVTKH